MKEKVWDLRCVRTYKNVMEVSTQVTSCVEKCLHTTPFDRQDYETGGNVTKHIVLNPQITGCSSEQRERLVLSFQVTPDSQSDFGSYNCTAVNMMGTESKEFILIQAGVFRSRIAMRSTQWARRPTLRFWAVNPVWGEMVSSQVSKHSDRNESEMVMSNVEETDVCFMLANEKLANVSADVLLSQKPLPTKWALLSEKTTEVWVEKPVAQQ